MTASTSSACWARGGPTCSRGVPRARTGAASTCTPLTHARIRMRWLRGCAKRVCTLTSWGSCA
eukprot:8843930-Alexandrium_andersonii.AAC.1